MPLPLILWGAAALAGVVGIGKGIEAGSNNSKAKEYIEDAEDIFEDGKYRLEYQQKTTSEYLENLGKIKLYCWSNSIKCFLDIFNEFKNVRFEDIPNIDSDLKNNLNSISLKNMTVASLKAQEVVKGGIGALSAGALAGIASYGGAMMFATASTGTAIASLSGVAATNATLAWLGGGSLAAGGFGMAGGMVALGGITLGPVMAVAGFIMAAKSEENLLKAKQHYEEARNAVAKMDSVTSFLKSIANLSEGYENFIKNFSSKFDILSNQVKQMHNVAFEEQSNLLINKIKRFFGIKLKVDYHKLNLEEKQLLHLYCVSAQLLNSILSTSLIDEKGNLQQTAQKILKNAEESSVKLLN